MVKRIERILAVDQGNESGFAVKVGDRITWGSRSFKHYHDNAARWFAFHGWFSDLILENEPKCIAYEKPFFRGKASMQLYGYAVLIEMIAHIYETPCLEIHGQTIKKHAGIKSGKPILEAENRWGHIAPIANDHEADALWLLDYVATNAEYTK